jgi:diguanylate cyclase (GGDEF)-like protein
MSSMLHKIWASEIRKRLRKRPVSSWNIALPWMLIVPFILQVLVIVSLVGYLSYQNGERAVADLTNQLTHEFSERVDEKLTSYLATAKLANQLNSNAVARGELKLDLEQSHVQREQYLWQQMQLFSNLAWISLGAEKTGDSLGIWRPGAHQDLQSSISNQSTDHFGNYYGLDRQGKRTTKLKIEKPAFDARTRPWYKEAVAAKKAIWTSIYAGFTPGTLFIAASQPLYQQDGQLVGVSATDISILDIQAFLAQHPVSPTGQTFVIEKSGLLVASSSEEKIFSAIAGQQPQRVRALDSETPLIKATMQALKKQVGDLNNIQQKKKLHFNPAHQMQNHQMQNFQFELDRQKQFVHVSSLTQQPGLDWLVVIVVPETDVMAEIHAGTQSTIWLCLLALLGIIVLNILISQWLAQPIRALSQAMQKIAQGNFDDHVNSSGIREFSTLAIYFRKMSQEIQQSRSQLEEYSRSLEQQVSDRTQALQQEIKQRQIAEASLQIANQELQNLAYMDGMTHIANRRRFDEQLDQEWCRMKREQQPLSLILCDVDYFKQYNDTYGHQLGDECLCHIARAIVAAARRSTDLVARYGGEEFVMLLPNTPLAGAKQVANSVQSNIKKLQLHHRNSDVSKYVTASYGVACMMPDDHNEPRQLLLRVDKALYYAKRSGRNRIADS